MAAQRKYPEELRERAVKMVSEIREQDGKGHGELARVGRQLGVHPEALRSWVKQAEIDGGERPGTTTGDKQRIFELEREVRELRRANEILKAAGAYFARELDPRLPRNSFNQALTGQPAHPSQQRAAFTWTTATSTAGMTRTPQSSPRLALLVADLDRRPRRDRLTRLVYAQGLVQSPQSGVAGASVPYRDAYDPALSA
jgi:transposase